jgi:hypothetical protein
MLPNLVLLDNNSVRRLYSPKLRDRLRANLRAMHAEFWPTAVNVLEATKSRDRETRTQMLTTLGDLAGQHHAFPLPTDALRKVAEAIANGAPTVEWAEPGFTYLFREPESVTDEEAAEIRDYLIAQEASFREMHERAALTLRPVLKQDGGHRRWTSIGQFLDEIWNAPGHLEAYVSAIWELWDLRSPPPVEAILKHEAWRLFFDGWGASAYAHFIAHPQLPLVEAADLHQLVYLASARNRILVSGDHGFQRLASSILDGRYPLARIVSLKNMLG